MSPTQSSESTKSSDSASSYKIPYPQPTDPPPSSLTALHWLPLYLRKADLHIDRLSRILSTSSGTDTLLLTLGYTSLFSSSLLTSISFLWLRKSAKRSLEKAVWLPPNFQVSILLNSSFLSPSTLLNTARRLKAFSSLVSDFRIFARLWGLISIWKWGKSLIDSPHTDPYLRWLSYTQVLVNIFYQYLENFAYLSSKKAWGWSVQKQNRAWLWSSRCWMVHVGLDMIRLYREWLRNNGGDLRMETGKERSEGAAKANRSDEAWKARWRREMVLNLAYAPLTVHWSLEKGLFSDLWVGLLGSVAGISSFRALWKGTT